MDRRRETRARSIAILLWAFVLAFSPFIVQALLAGAITPLSGGGGSSSGVTQFTGDMITALPQRYLNNSGTDYGGAVAVLDVLALSSTTGTNTATFTVAANELQIDPPGVSGFISIIGTDPQIRFDIWTAQTAATPVRVLETDGFSIESSAGANDALFTVAAGTLTLDVATATGVFIIASGDRITVDRISSTTSNTTLTADGNGTGGVSVGTEPFEFSNLSGAGGADANGDQAVRIGGTYVRRGIGTLGQTWTVTNTGLPSWEPPAAGRGETVSLNVSQTSADAILFTADSVYVADGIPTTGTLLKNVSVTPSKATAGPAANGRDQAGAFADNTWVYGYVILDPSTGTVAGLWSLSPTAPTMPTGYTQWALVHMSNTTDTATGGFLPQIGTNRTILYTNNQSQCLVLNAGNATGITSVSLTSRIPPQSRIALLGLRLIGASVANALSIYSDTSAFSVTERIFYYVATTVTQASTEVPTTAAQLVYYNVSNAGDSAFIHVRGFRW